MVDADLEKSVADIEQIIDGLNRIIEGIKKYDNDKFAQAIVEENQKYCSQGSKP